jgi:uncharacterized membrane protein
MAISNLSFTLIDYLAITIFYFGWVGYAKFARRAANNGMPSLMSVMVRYREDWWRGTIGRDLKIVDTNIILTLSNGATFFASTTILILGALLALLGTTDLADQFNDFEADFFDFIEEAESFTKEYTKELESGQSSY